jgi:thioredoxin-related protein
MPAGKRYKKGFFIILCLALTVGATAQLKQYDFSQVDSLQRSCKKTIVVFIHTDWCKYCIAMHQTTFKDKEVTRKLNDNFYFVALNAEEKKDITFNGYTFKYKQSGTNTGLHELAAQLSSTLHETSYPTLCFLNDKNEIIYQYGSFLSAKQLTRLLDNF